MVLIGALVGVVFNVTSAHVHFSQRAVNRATAEAFGDAVMENLFDQWRQAMAGVTNDTDRQLGLSTSSLAALLIAPSTTELPRPASVSLVSWSVVAATPLLQPTTDPSGRPILERPDSGSPH